jgi:hypothetical protein
LDIYWGASDRIYDYWLIVEVVGTLVHWASVFTLRYGENILGKKAHTEAISDTQPKHHSHSGTIEGAGRAPRDYLGTCVCHSQRLYMDVILD